MSCREVIYLTILVRIASMMDKRVWSFGGKVLTVENCITGRKHHYNGVSVKGEAFLVHTVKTYRWSRGIAPLILNLDTRWG
jgi:hypothetical protein